MRVAIAAALMGLFVMTATAGAPISGVESQETQDVIVVFNDDVGDPAQVAADLTRANGGQLGFVYEHAIKGFSGTFSSRAVAAIERSPRVAYVELDQEVSIVAQTLPEGVDRIDADQNSTANIDGNDERVDVDVAIIDTGIDLDHPDLNPVDGTDCIDPDTTAEDGHGHGTHVAGTAAAIDNGSDVVGVAPGARVHAVRVLDDSGSGTISSVVCGIDWVTKNAHTTNDGTIEVANMSLGAQGQSPSLRTAIQNSVDVGVFYAVAAGNDGQDVYGSDGTFGTSDDFIPAAYPEVAAVSAMADFDGSAGGNGGSTLLIGCGRQFDDTMACFTNFSASVGSDNPVNSPGKAIDVAAPGVSVFSTDLNGSTSTKSGTSMASPHVAGAAALYIVKNGGASDATGVAAIRQALIDSGQPQSDWSSGSTDDPDGNLEPLVYVADSEATDQAPSVSWVNPSDGDTVSGTETIQIDASDSEDSDDSLTVEWRVDGGTWQTAAHNTDTGYYEDSWDTTSGLEEGDHTLDAQATDSDGNTNTATITVTVDNDADPTVSWMNPLDDDTVSGTETIQIDASDTEDSDDSLTVEWRVDGGTWQAAAYNTDTGYYEDSWDTTSVGDGSYVLDARATDSASQTSSASITVTVDNVEGIDLTATGYKVRGMHTVDLSWSGASSTEVDIHRNGDLIATTDNDGEYTDSMTNRGPGSYTYEVCEAGTSTCSNEATVDF